MAFANSAISDIIATTIESRTKSAQDNLTNNNALLMRLKEKGNVKPITGGRDRKSTRLNSSHIPLSRMPSSA